MDSTRKNELAENSYSNCGLPITRAEAMLRNCLNAEVRTKDILSALRIKDNPKGNKQWEIELLLKDPRSMDQSTTGFFACHQSKGFITYSITLNGQEYWFDRYQAALEFLGFELEPVAENLS